LEENNLKARDALLIERKSQFAFKQARGLKESFQCAHGIERKWPMSFNLSPSGSAPRR
jgi:hypothetical protein